MPSLEQAARRALAELARIGGASLSRFETRSDLFWHFREIARTASSALHEALQQATAEDSAAQGAAPVAWQHRTRPTWDGSSNLWSPWEPCTKAQAEDCWKTPLLHGWAYEARALYTETQPTCGPLTQEQLAHACLAYRHDFGLLSKEEQEQLIFQAREWERAIQKGLGAA